MFQVFDKQIDRVPLLDLDLNSDMDSTLESNDIEVKAQTTPKEFRKKSLIALSSREVIEHLSLYEDMQPVLLIERTLGIFPVQKVNTEFQLCTWMMVYSLAFYVTHLVLDVIFYYPWLRDAANEGLDDFTESMTLTLSIAVQFLILMIPAVNWPEVKGVARYFLAWEEFQTSFLNNTGVPLKFHFYRRILIFCSISVTFHSIIAILDSHANYHSILLFESVTEFLLFLCLYTLRDMLAFHWYFVCRGLSMASQRMLQLFQKEMKTTPNQIQCIIKYRSLWWELSKLARQLGTTYTYTYFFLILYLFVTLVMYVHFVVVVILKPQNILGIILCLTEILNIIFLLFLLCKSANNATNHIMNDFRHELVAIGQEHTDVETRRSIKEFLRTTDFEPPKINLGGYVDVNSKLFFLLTVILVTYTVLLTQVGLSVPEEEDDEPDNVTTTTPIPPIPAP